ncbi:MAG TPA: hypothetical protein DDZ41_06745 [Flavobacterium sp.]|nr:hypothetical protein [Flavobacterium sp.]
MCYVGQLLVFEEAEEAVNILTGVGFNAKQIERVCHKYGNWLEKTILMILKLTAMICSTFGLF